MKPQSGIFWIASYPKSGNTWVRMILASLLAAGRTPDLQQFGAHCPSGAVVRWLEDILDIDLGEMTGDEVAIARAQAHQAFARRAGHRWLKIHDCRDPDLFPGEVTAGTVYIVRDPRDVASSFADHMNLDLDTAIAWMGEMDFTMSRVGSQFQQHGPQMFGSWSQNVRSWLDAPPRPLLVLRYEDLLARPAQQVARLARFMDLPDDPATVEAAAKACAFDVLQAGEDAHGFRERAPHQPRFFRHGRAGAWRQTLSLEQAHRLWDDHGAVMQALGYGAASSGE